MAPKRMGAACGSVMVKMDCYEQAAIIVAGGQNEDKSISRYGFISNPIYPKNLFTDDRLESSTSELYIVDDDLWTRGPKLPREYAYGGFTNYGEGNFVLGGGIDSNETMHNDIIRLMGNEFVTLEGRMEQARTYFSIVALEDDEVC